MGNTRVTATVQFPDEERFPGAPFGPAAGLVTHLGAITSAGTMAPAGEIVHAPLPGRRQPVTAPRRAHETRPHPL